jgi:glycosyltransferase involved in cell wall biosynthesis
MPEPANNLRILHRKAIYPGISGGRLRTMNIARLAREVFGSTRVFSMDNRVDYEGTIDGIPVIQKKEFHTVVERLGYYAHAMSAREFIVPYTKLAFDNPKNTLFQIEDPLLYPLLKKEKISRFILDEHNVNWEIMSLNPEPELKKQIYRKMWSGRDRENEKRALKYAAQVLCCSSRDREIFISEVPGIEDSISVIPNCVNLTEYDTIRQSTPREKEDKECRILFVGTLHYPPNNEAVRFICQIIAARSPDNYHYIIVGKNPPAIDHPQNVEFAGYITDVRRVIVDADICIAPIRSGSGTRLKILEYMAMGKPVIATSKGAEGIEYTDGLNIIIEDRIEKYPEIIRQLFDDEKKRSALGRESVKLIREKYDWERYRKPLEKIYRGLV